MSKLPADETNRPSVIRPATFSISERRKIIDDCCKDNELARLILRIETKLADDLMELDYGPKVTHVYNPIDYALRPHLEFFTKYCRASATVVLVGENPGPFGMAQSGIPFGEVSSVKEYLKIEERRVGTPHNLHKSRPINGFDTTRKEGSGSRMWSFIKSHFENPENFFVKAFIYNHCPLIYMSESGSNITPAQMPAAVRKAVNSICDRALVDIVRLFPACTTLAGIGRFTEGRIKFVSQEFSLPYHQIYLMHPSPRNPTATKEWPRIAAEAFSEMGLIDGNPSKFALTPENQTVPNIERKRKAKGRVAHPSKKSVRRKLFD